MKGIKPIIKIDPFIMLGICFILNFFMYESWYPKLYAVLANIVGFSIRTNVRDLYFIRRNNMCTYTLVATLGLLVINIIDLIHVIKPIPNFYQLYFTILSGSFLAITSIYYIKNIIETK